MYQDNKDEKPFYPQPQQPSTGFPFAMPNSQYHNSDSSPFQLEPQLNHLPWSTGLCHCFDDVPNCCITWWCPCITFGQIAEIVDKGSTSCGASGALYTLILCMTGCSCIYSYFYRAKMRGQYSLQASPCNDCLIHCFCEPCALCQEYRELKRRGFNMDVGWHANMERQGRAAAVITAPPIVPGGMTR